MKKNVLLKTFVIAMFGLSALSTWFAFAPNSNHVAHADSSVIIINPIAPVSINESFNVRATLIGSTYSGVDIEWLINNQVVTQINKIEIPSDAPEASVLKMYSSEYKNQVQNQEVWVFQARLKQVHSVSAYTTVTFKSSDNPLTINALTSQKQTYSSTPSPFTFEVIGLEEETAVEWFTLANSNKYIKVAGATQRTYTFTPQEAGKYSFVAKVGTVFSDNFEVAVEYKPLPDKLEFTVNQTTDNASGFNTYIFELSGVNASNDVDNINWYIQGQQLPAQYGGSTFIFEPSSYITYRIYAKYTNPENTTETLSSESYTIEVRIDRTADILIGSAITIAVIGIGTLISIIVNIKREKIW